MIIHHSKCIQTKKIIKLKDITFTSPSITNKYSGANTGILYYYQVYLKNLIPDLNEAVGVSINGYSGIDNIYMPIIAEKTYLMIYSKEQSTPNRLEFKIQYI